jgi:hypothetical protein
VVALGAGHDRAKRQHCMALRIGEAETFTGRPLRSFDCLRAIVALPHGPAYVTYGLAFLAAHVLHDIPAERFSNDKKRGIFDDKEWSNYTIWNDYGIWFLPGNFLRICRYERRPVLNPISNVIEIRQVLMKDTARTITDVSGCFRKPLVKALRDFAVGPEHWETLAADKAGRLDLARVTVAARRSVALECDLLAELMTRFRAMAHDAGLRPQYWSGAGKLATALLRQNHTLTAGQLTGLVPAELLTIARKAFYGGRFETPRIGEVSGPVIEHDLNGGFPAAMMELPCLRHGRWHPIEAGDFAALPADSLFVASVAFRHPAGQFLCGLPVRKASMGICYPIEGAGTYWSPDLRSAERLGASIEYRSGWLYTRHCRCCQFPWVEGLYEKRLAYGKDLQGETIKTAMAALYGKLIQRRGSARYENFVWGGLVTSITRGWINDAIALAPDSIVMIASDAVYSRTPLPLPLGEALGEWKTAEHARVFIVQSGLWWGANRPRSRGVPINFFEPHCDRFERDWRRWLALGNPAVPPPIVRVPLKLFISLRLAHARGDMTEARKLIEDGDGQGRAYAFRWGDKRGRGAIEGGHVKTWPIRGGEESMGHGETPEVADDLDRGRLEYEALPDTLDLSIPFR